MKTLLFSVIFPDPYFLILAAVEKPGFRGISTFLVYTSGLARPYSLDEPISNVRDFCSMISFQCVK